MVIRKAYFIDADYIIKNNETYAKLFVKGKTSTTLYYKYDPYFYVLAPPEKKDEIEKIAARAKSNEIVTPLRSELVERIVGGKKKTLIKVYCKKPSHVPVLQQALRAYQSYEHNIPFRRRFMLDFSLIPFSIIKYERDGRLIKRIISIEEAKTPVLSTLAVDIETYNPLGTPREKKDPILMISWCGKESGVLTYKKSTKKFVRCLENEKSIIEELCEIVKKDDPDIIFGYNSGVFDLPYLQTRARIVNAAFNIGRGKKGNTLKKLRKGMISGTRINGRIHVDLYPIVRFFGFIGLIKAQDFTLGEISKSVFGKKKFDITRSSIWKIWDSGDIDELAEYSLTDAMLTKNLGDYYLPLLIELSRIARLPLFDITLSTSGQLVENFLMAEGTKRGIVTPPRPSDAVINERLAAPIKGAFVKLPEPGIYENIGVLDFRGMYPSIIVSYNIDPFTITDDEDSYVSPTGTKFSKKEKGLIPSVLENLIELRAQIKNELKKCKKESSEYLQLSARSHALKILANSFYGFLGYARSRWYCRECAESVTAWGRKHIIETMEKAEKEGFTVIYGDTDSLMILYKNKKDVLDFIEKINKELPGKMELELEGFYPRGVFVSKKAEERGAKKKYALLGEDGRIKIRGFELVRRDWSEIAKKTQYDVLETILKEGDTKKAVEIVKKAIERLRSGNVNIEELAIETQLNKEPTKYEVKSPELAAAAKGIERGLTFEKGSIVSYVITKSGKTISEKAQLTEFAKDYDADYYINNQVLPAVLKILKELGYDEDALKIGGKQQDLEAFF
jgi:DNA polymerase I